MADRYSQRSYRHSHMRTLALQWIRKHKPKVYQWLKRQALERYPKAVSNSNNEGR